MPGEHGFCVLTQESHEALKAKIKSQEAELTTLRASLSKAQLAQARVDRSEATPGGSIATSEECEPDALDDAWSEIVRGGR